MWRKVPHRPALELHTRAEDHPFDIQGGVRKAFGIGSRPVASTRRNNKNRPLGMGPSPCKPMPQRDCGSSQVRSRPLMVDKHLRRFFREYWGDHADGDRCQTAGLAGVAEERLTGSPKSTLQRARAGKYPKLLGSPKEIPKQIPLCATNAHRGVIMAGHYLDSMCAASIKFDRWHHILQKALQWCNNAQKFGRMSSAYRWF